MTGRGVTAKQVLSTLRLAVALLCCGLAAQAQAAGDDCFTRQDNRGLAYRVLQVGAPPLYSAADHDYALSSPVYPATDYVTAAMARIAEPSPPSASGLAFRKYFLLWANRCSQFAGPGDCRNARTKGNGYPAMLDDGRGGKVRAAFSSYERADACTLIQAKRVLGQRAGLEAEARRAGLTLWDSPDRQGLQPMVRAFAGPDGAPLSSLVDVCVLETTPEAGDAAGIALDYEVTDGRTPQQATELVETLARLTHASGKSILLTTDPLPRPVNGLVPESMQPIVEAVDGFIPVVSTGASLPNPSTGFPAHLRQRTPEQAYAGQLDAVSAGYRGQLSPSTRRKIIWNVSLYDLSLAEASDLRRAILAGGYGGVMISRSFLKEGGSCARPENQVIACLTKGVCDGRFGTGR